MLEFNKNVKIVILSTLAEKKTLAEIGHDWFGNRSRLYLPQNIKYIQEAVDGQWLIVEDNKFYKANVEKILETFIKEVTVKGSHKLLDQYKEHLRNFYLALAEYTHKVYFNYEIIRALTGFKPQEAMKFDFILFFQLPFLLHLIDMKGSKVAPIIVQMMHLEDYILIVNDLEQKYFSILQRQRRVDMWLTSISTLAYTLFDMQKKKLLIVSKTYTKAARSKSK